MKKPVYLSTRTAQPTGRLDRFMAERPQRKETLLLKHPGERTAERNAKLYWDRLRLGLTFAELAEPLGISANRARGIFWRETRRRRDDRMRREATTMHEATGLPWRVAMDIVERDEGLEVEPYSTVGVFSMQSLLDRQP